MHFIYGDAVTRKHFMVARFSGSQMQTIVKCASGSTFRVYKKGKKKGKISLHPRMNLFRVDTEVQQNKTFVSQDAPFQG